MIKNVKEPTEDIFHDYDFSFCQTRSLLMNCLKWLLMVESYAACVCIWNLPPNLETSLPLDDIAEAFKSGGGY